VRAAGTIGDVFNSAVATIGAAESALGALSAAVVAEINHLHELHSGAADLFAQAQALADEAEQAEGDAGAELFAQAARARTEAEELERAQQKAAEEIAAQAEQIEDATRRAARAGMRAAAEQIEDATAAIKTFGGGYGPGLGLENGALSTKEKIALASQVGRSRRLKQVAALCGRLTRIALHVQSTRVQYPPDEVADIRYGSDIGRVLPSELALLADPALEALFFHRYAEGQLMQYELLGNEKQGQGPIILAVDTSGSMTESLGGIAKDVWAKAVMLALMAIARLQERDMVAFLFSGSAHELTRFDFPKGRAAHQTVITAVETFYNGGTVFEPWMESETPIWARTLLIIGGYQKEYTMHVYAVALEKGGVGKTSIAVNLAVAFALVDLKVLLIDLDAQCHASQWLGVQIDQIRPYDSMLGVVQGRPLAECVRPTQENVAVLPAHPAMVGLPAMLVGAPNNGIFALKNALEKAQASGAGYDVVILDLAPARGPVQVTALAAATRCIAPVQAEDLVLQSLKALADSVDQARQINPRLRGVCVVRNRYALRGTVDHAYDQALRGEYGPQLLRTILPTRAALRHAAGV
jgi:chromosome partitioning protein